MITRCYAISKKNGVVTDLGAVTDMDWLYHFESKRPPWSEPHEIIFDDSAMRKAWDTEEDLWLILPGEPPVDIYNSEKVIFQKIFNTLSPLVIILTVSSCIVEKNSPL